MEYFGGSRSLREDILFGGLRRSSETHWRNCGDGRYWGGVSRHGTRDVFRGKTGVKEKVTGYAPDEFLMIETEDEDWVTEEGADGQVVRSMIPNAIAKITLTLQQTSITNDLLTQLHACGKGFDTANKVGLDIFTFTVKPPLAYVGDDASLFSSANCYVSKIAPMTYAKESGTRTWEITAVDGVFGADTLASYVQGVGNLARDISGFSGLVS